MTVGDIRRRRLAGQHLTALTDRRTAARDLCGVQAQFMANALHALRIRSRGWDAAAAGDGLVKNWTIRGTVHVFDEADLPLFLHCRNGEDYRRNMWDGVRFWNQRERWALSPERQAALSRVILDALSDGPQTREALKEICRAHGMNEAEEGCMFDSWGGGVRELCERGFMHYAVQEKKAFCLTPPFVPIPEEAAMCEIARRYFTFYGPATVHDAMYYFHAPARQVQAWLDALPVRAADCEGRRYYWIGGEGDGAPEVPRCLFLAGFDPLMLGYEKRESLFLAPHHLRAIFNLAGIVMPSVLLDGSVVGRWRLAGRRVCVALFAPVDARGRAAIAEKAAALWPDAAVEWSEI